VHRAVLLNTNGSESSSDFCTVKSYRCWAPRENGVPKDPRILTFCHSDFGAPFQLVRWRSGEESLVHKRTRTMASQE